MFLFLGADGSWRRGLHGCPFYKRGRKIEGMFSPIALRAEGSRIADGYWGLGGVVQD